ncbi:MAG: hypothetical protein RR304_03395 [Bacteroides sp.]
MYLLLLLRHLIKSMIETIAMMKYYPHTVTSLCSMSTTLWG